MKKQVKQNKLSLDKLKVAKINKIGKRVIIGGNGGECDGIHTTGHGQNGMTVK